MTAAPCRREQARAAVAQPSTIRTDDAPPLDVTIEDLSPAGFSFTSALPIPTGSVILVGLAGAGRATAEVAWHSGDRHGCRFRPALTAAQADAAFSQPRDASIVRLAPAATRRNRSASTSAPNPAAQAPGSGAVRPWPPVARLAVMAGSGAIGWAMLAMWLRA